MNREQFRTDPSEPLRSALHEFVDVGLEALASWLRHASERAAVPPAASTHDDVAAAASLLGVDHNAGVDEIRAAFRACVKCSMTTGQFHDQAGDATDRRARELIDAKNLLLAGQRDSFKTYMDVT